MVVGEATAKAVNEAPVAALRALLVILFLLHPLAPAENLRERRVVRLQPPEEAKVLGVGDSFPEVSQALLERDVVPRCLALDEADGAVDREREQQREQREEHERSADLVGRTVAPERISDRLSQTLEGDHEHRDFPRGEGCDGRPRFGSAALLEVGDDIADPLASKEGDRYRSKHHQNGPSELPRSVLGLCTEQLALLFRRHRDLVNPPAPSASPRPLALQTFLDRAGREDVEEMEVRPPQPFRELL
mmetsp:Transcript_60234/g.141875  ORF Transcript_60234/g.141875 Transcript_60234/m.141875 type:complete len:247 (-) Transcript_60234:103-843(-)